MNTNSMREVVFGENLSRLCGIHDETVAHITSECLK